MTYITKLVRYSWLISMTRILPKQGMNRN